MLLVVMSLCIVFEQIYKNATNFKNCCCQVKTLFQNIEES